MSIQVLYLSRCYSQGRKRRFVNPKTQNYIATEVIIKWKIQKYAKNNVPKNVKKNGQKNFANYHLLGQ